MGNVETISLLVCNSLITTSVSFANVQAKKASFCSLNTSIASPVLGVLYPTKALFVCVGLVGWNDS
jgi:hypothetical protein